MKNRVLGPNKYLQIAGLVSILLTVPSLGRCGGESAGGGGDPDVIQFLQLGQEFVDWLGAHSVDSIRVTAPEIDTKIRVIKSSLDTSGQAKLVFTSDKVFDENHNEKAAHFDRLNNSIIVQQQRWSKDSLRAKYNLVMTELLGLCGSEKRYSDVLAIAVLDGSQKLQNQSKVANTLCGVPIKLLGTSVGGTIGEAIQNFISEGADVKTCKLDSITVVVASFPNRGEALLFEN